MANLSINILNLLVQQYQKELTNSIKYTQFAGWASINGLNNIEKLFLKESKGELEHAEKVREFIFDRNERIDGIEILSEGLRIVDITELFETALLIEQSTTDSLNNIYKESLQELDLQTVSWIGELIYNQVEEENLYQTILDRISVYPDCPSRLHDIDMWIVEME